ncbi:Cytochrome c554 and c-prime [Desulfacinum hydrothermale DSM 13146]|uniref:Cytochrome c554 and c-prime n=1 Tax=Desulfacinum hydrothermale DSM 13146 TaxID=1121390 RepID=A0A1W1XTG0_9BACT|nr:cytochrome c family protein [Desulfacinum hydrothermale]SMC27135.1 Cytochrome c554 and c-prime [Desulfacinum hydrothermale DSM 13146]
MKKTIVMAAAATLLWVGLPQAQDQPHYVGDQTCAQCHEEIHERFMQYSKKPHSFQGVEKLQDGLSPQELQDCYACHTTGYGQPGGFTDPVSTPDMKNLGCESCHGPGSVHAETEDPQDIRGKITVQDCQRCHNEERVRAFNFQPLIHSGAH